MLNFKLALKSLKAPTLGLSVKEMKAKLADH